jgi:hypothetical protein
MSSSPPGYGNRDDHRVAGRFYFNPKKSGPDQAVPVIFLATAESERYSSLPRETVIDHRYLIGSAPPFPNQPGSRFQFETSTAHPLGGG